MTATPPIVDRETWQKQIDTQRVREKAHTREGTRLPSLAGGCRWSRSTPTSAVVGDAGEVPLIDTFQEPVAAVCVGARRRVALRARVSTPLPRSRAQGMAREEVGQQLRRSLGVALHHAVGGIWQLHVLGV
jgi:hypothetical protein